MKRGSEQCDQFMWRHSKIVGTWQIFNCIHSRFAQNSMALSKTVLAGENPGQDDVTGSGMGEQLPDRSTRLAEAIWDKSFG
jgi:hypothetical protein